MKLLNKIKTRNHRVFLFFDYDGVLVPLRHNPDVSYLPKRIQGSLLNLSKKSNIKIALVSGRNLKTLKRLIKFKSKKITLIGSHGLEMQYQGKKKYLFPKNMKEVKTLKKDAIKLARTIANGFLEEKPYSFTYHIRDKRKKDFVKKLSKAIKHLVHKKKLHKKLNVLEGKKMVEILPKEATKGKAVEKIIKLHPRYSYVYFGDDVTDISAFKMVKKYRGTSVSLNPGLNYKADIYLRSPKEVERFMVLLPTRTRGTKLKS